MTDTPLTAQRAMAEQSNSRLRFAVDRLLHRLKPFMRAWPYKQDDAMPDYDLGWVTDVDGGPHTVIGTALKAHPVLWMATLPDDVCLVRRRDLATAGLAPEVVKYLAITGEHIVLIQGEDHRRQEEERERMKRWQD